jgi:hypothetical protein
MHSILTARRALVAVATTAAVAALPTAASAAAFPPGPTATAFAAQAAGPDKSVATKKKHRHQKQKPAPTKAPVEGGVGAPGRTPAEDVPSRIPTGDGGGLEKPPLNGGDDFPSRIPNGSEGGLEKPPLNDAAGATSGGESDLVVKRPPKGLATELTGLREAIGDAPATTPEDSATGSGASLADQLEGVRTAIVDRNAGQLPNGIRAVTMGPARLRVSDAGVAACGSSASRA